MVKLKLYNRKGDLEGEYQITSKKNILDEVLDNGGEILYGCFGGSCATCISTILSGKEFIDMEGIRAFVYRGLNEDEFLPCIAKIKEDAPVDAVVEIRKRL